MQRDGDHEQQHAADDLEIGNRKQIDDDQCDQRPHRGVNAQQQPNEECRTRAKTLDIDRDFKRTRKSLSAHHSSAAIVVRTKITGAKLVRWWGVAPYWRSALPCISVP